MKKIILLLFLIGLISSCTKSNTNTMNNKQIVSQFFELVSKGDTDEAFKLIDTNVNWWIPGDLPFSGNKSKEEYFQVVNAIKKGFPTGFKLNVISMIAEGNTVATEVESEGNHINGKVYNNKYHFLFKIEGNKIISVKEYMDTLHLYNLLKS